MNTVTVYRQSGHCMWDSSLQSVEVDYAANARICKYWNIISDVPNDVGGKKYSSLSRVAMAAWTLAHGNAIPERGFSVNNAMLGKERLSLEEQTIVAERVVKDAIKLFGTVTNVPITKELLISARKAHSKYVVYLKQQRKLKELNKKARLEQEQEEEQRKQANKMKEDAAKQLLAEEKFQDELTKEQDVAHQLISEASTKLSAALKTNKFS